MADSKTILVCPLNWGIGHAARLVPVIQELLNRRQKVVIAANGRPLAFLVRQFPGSDFIRFPSHEPRYATANHQFLKLASQTPDFISSYYNDRKKIDSIVKTTHADAIISDNRFGAFSKEIPSVYITHQLHLVLPSGLGFLRPIADHMHHRIIKNYSECWIPDYDAADNLAGRLSSPLPKKGRFYYIGLLSRFENYGSGLHFHPEQGLLVLLSGPEPQRTILENVVLNQLRSSTQQSTILRGLPEHTEIPELPPHIRMINHTDDTELAGLISGAKYIIARAGYSTIMDLMSLGRTATLIPTPGQSEQEYLADRLHRKAVFQKVSQADFLLDKVLQYASTQPFSYPKQPSVLETHIHHWLKRI